MEDDAIAFFNKLIDIDQTLSQSQTPIEELVSKGEGSHLNSKVHTGHQRKENRLAFK